MKKSKPILACECISVDFSELMPIISESFAMGKSVKIPVKGTSMLPLLREGRDAVMLSALSSEPAKWDVVLYKRDNGDYVLHRIIAVKGDRYTMCGDNQHRVERGIRRDQIIAVVTSYFKGEKEMSISSLPYRFYCARRAFIRRAKNLVFRIKRWLTRSGR